MATPLPPGAAPPVSRARQRRAINSTLRTLVIMAGVAIACMAGGWYFVQGPGGAVLKDAFTRARNPVADPEDAPAVADDTRNNAPTPSHDPPPPPRSEPPVNASPPEQPDVKPPPMKPPEPARPAGLTFLKDVLPIFQAKCVNCHNDDKKRGGLDVTTLAALLKGGDSGPSVVTGSLDRGTLWGAISTNQMPPTPNKLTPGEKKVIQDWILGGAKGGPPPPAGL